MNFKFNGKTYTISNFLVWILLLPGLFLLACWATIFFLGIVLIMLTVAPALLLQIIITDNFERH